MILKNKSFWYLIFILFLTLSETAFTVQKMNHILTLNTEDEFLSLLDQNNSAIIFCSMDNCPHCKMIGPEFEKLAQKYSKNILFYQANGPKLHIHNHVKRETNEKFKIPGYPVFLFIKNKKIDNVLIGANKQNLASTIKEFALKL